MGKKSWEGPFVLSAFLDLPLKNKSSQEMQGSFHSLQPCGKRKQGIKVLYCHVSEILLKDSLQV